MKRILIFIIVVACAACHDFHHGVRGSGTLAREKRDVSSFTSIYTEGEFEVDVVCQKTQSLEIEGDDNILPLISTEVSNNVLRVKPVRDYSVSEPIKLKISVPDLAALTVTGAGKASVSGLHNDKFEIVVNGAPTIRASGDTAALSIDSNGAAKVDTHKLHAAKVTVESKGVSSVQVYASEKLDVTVSGPSHVTYEGEATVNKTINGPGSVEKKASQSS